MTIKITNYQVVDGDSDGDGEADQDDICPQNKDISSFNFKLHSTFNLATG